MAARPWTPALVLGTDAIGGTPRRSPFGSRGDGPRVMAMEGCSLVPPCSNERYLLGLASPAQRVHAIVWFDGACSGNPGPMGAGAVVHLGNQHKVLSLAKGQ